MVVNGKIVSLEDCMIKTRIPTPKPKPKPKPAAAAKTGEYVWVAYDKSRARLPVAVALSIAELAKLTGVNEKVLLQRWYNYKQGRSKTTRCAKVYIGGQDDELETGH